MKSMINTVTSTIFKKTAYALGMFSLVTALTTGTANAQRSPGPGHIIPSKGTWTHVASACTPDEDTIDYQMIGAGVTFPGSITGDITLRCNITNVMDPNLPWSVLEVVYRDPDGSGTANQVIVSLYAVALDGEAENKITVLDPSGRPRAILEPSLVQTFNSNVAANATSSPRVQTVGINHSFDFANNAYYIKIKIKRDAGTTTNPAAFLVRLYGQIFFG